MNWEHRLRDMVLAGAALTAAACSDSAPVDASGSGSGSASVSSGASTGFPCCNANGDPCCPFIYCGEPMSSACACTSDGGTWSYTATTCSFSKDAGPPDAVENKDAANATDGPSEAAKDDDAADATNGPTDAIDDKDATQANDGPSDASTDSMSHHDVDPFCCNANPDPCCRFQYCGEPMTPACACKSDGGTWGSGSVCTFPPEAGSSETGVDGGAHD